MARAQISTTLNRVTRRENNGETRNNKQKPSQSLLNQMGFSIIKTIKRNSKRQNTSPLESQVKAQDNRPTPDMYTYVCSTKPC